MRLVSRRRKESCRHVLHLAEVRNREGGTSFTHAEVVGRGYGAYARVQDSSQYALVPWVM